MPLLSVLVHHQSRCKIKLLLTLLILPVNLHLHLSLHQPLGVKFARALHLIMAINCVTYNCRGWNSGSATISDLIDLFDIYFIQEHWLLTDQLHILSSYHPEFAAVSVSRINDDEVLSGRPYGGCAILYRSSLSSSITLRSIISSKRFCALKVKDQSGLSILFVCVYMPSSDIADY